MDWIDRYRAYDDDTLAVLASPGLLRRAAKDVEAGRVALEGYASDQGVLICDGQRVTLGADGPQKAHCECPAPGMCRHIVSAVLWLRDRQVHADETSPSTDEQVVATPRAIASAATRLPETTESSALAIDRAIAAPAESRSVSPHADPLSEALSLSEQSLMKAAGAAAVRRVAAQPVLDAEWQVQSDVLVITLPALGQTCRWIAGAGFDGMVSEVPSSQRRMVHLLAVAALRRAHGQPMAWPGTEGTTSIEPSEGKPDGLTGREQAFVAQVDDTLQELLNVGLAHVGSSTSAHLLALNMSARGEGLPRLAALLRNLGGTVDLLVQRDHRAEERDALSAMARIHALCCALRVASGETVCFLKGRLQRDFDTRADMLDLLPLGAWWWQTRGGARGLTLALWDAQAARLLQATLARPDGNDPGFDSRRAWATHALWPGAGSAQRICEGGGFRLEHSRLTEDGRLALAGSARAQPAAAWTADDPRLDTLGFDDWAALAARLSDAAGLTGERIDAFVLRPAATAPPVLDEVGQRLRWPVQDAAGRWLVLSVPCDALTQRRADSLDRLIARGAEVRAVTVEVRRAGSLIELVPVAVLEEAPKAVLRCVSLDYANEPARTVPLGQRILRMLDSRRQRPTAAPVSLLTDRLLAPVLEVLETQAATGRAALTAAQATRLSEAAARLSAAGLVTPARAIEAHVLHPDASGMLRLYRQCDLLTELDGLSMSIART